MKLPALIAFSAVACFSASTLCAQETVITTTPVQPEVAATTTTTTTTINAAGTIQEFTPGTSRIIVRSATGAPVTYTYSRQTTFVDAAGNVVSAETIRPGEPTTVYYAMQAGQPVVSRIVVNRTVAPAPPATVVVPVAPAVPVTHIERTETTTTTTGPAK